MRSLRLPLAFVAVGFCLARAAGAQLDVFPAPTPVTPSINADFLLEINIHNAGPGDSTNLMVVTNLIPAGWTLVSASVGTYRVTTANGFTWYQFDPPANTNVTQNGRALSFRPHPVPSGWWRPIWIVARTGSTGLYTNTVMVNAGVPDVNPANNSLVHTIDVRPPSLSVAGGQTVAEQSGSNAVFVVRLAASNSVPVTVEFQTLDDTARAGEDFQAKSGVLTFPPGVLEQTVSVAVLDDALEEADAQSFTLRLTNAVNADIGAAAESNVILDDEPPIAVSVGDAAPVVEGDTGLTSAVFPLTLSGRADTPVYVDFATTQPLATNGTATIEAGETNGAFIVLLPGNVEVDSDRSFQVTLSNPRGTPGVSLAQTQAQGTILDDDALPGKFHRVTVNSVPSPQLAGRAIPVTVTLLDFFDHPVTNDLSPVQVTASALIGHTLYNVDVVNVSNFVNGVAQTSVMVSDAATNVTVTVWKPWGDWFRTALTPAFRVNPSPPLFLTAPSALTEGGEPPVTQARVSITNIDVQDVVVHLSVSDSQELTVPATVVIPAGQTSSIVEVTAIDDDRLDGSQTPLLFASALGYGGASVQATVHDNEFAALTVTMAPSHTEGSGSFLGTVSASSPVAVETKVNLFSSDTSELTVGCCMLLLAGQNSNSFSFNLPNDNLLDGPQPVTVTARVQNWIEGSATTVVLDNDTNLAVSLSQDNRLPVEGLGTRTNQLRVSLPGLPLEPITVQLISSDTTEVVVPPSVVIPAGLSSVFTDITFPEDDLFDGTQTVTITASAPGLNPGTRTVTVPDNDVHHLIFAPIGPLQTSGVPFRVMLTVKDVNDLTMTTFSGAIALGAQLEPTVLPVTPSAVSNFVRGSWSGNVTLFSWGTDLQLVATALGGVTASSNPFTIPKPDWLADFRILRIEWSGAGPGLFFNTTTGWLYQVETTPSLVGASWLPVGQIPGTGGEVSVVHSNAPVVGQRFYRLFVAP